MKTLFKWIMGILAVIVVVRFIQIVVDCLYDRLDRKYIVAEEEDPLYL